MKIFTKGIKIPSLKAWVQKPSGLIKDEGGEAQALYVGEMLNESREWVPRRKIMTNLKC